MDKFLEKCYQWFDNKINEDEISTIFSESDEGWEKRVYLIIQNKDGYTTATIFRIWAINDLMNVSVDYEQTTKSEDFYKTIPQIITTANRVK